MTFDPDNHDHDESGACLNDDGSVHEPEQPSYPFNPWGFLWNFMVFAEAVSANVTVLLRNIRTDVGAYNNARIDRLKAKQQRRSITEELEAFERWAGGEKS